MLRQTLSRLFSLGVRSTSARNMASKSPRDLTGRIAIVTASTDGIGLAIAKRLAEDGAKVMISSRNDTNVQKALESLYSSGISKDNVKGVVCEVGSQEDRTNLINSTVSNFGGVDILVSNAGINPAVGPMLDCPEKAWDKIFEINVKSAFLLSKEVVPHLKKRKGSNIVYISSIGAYHPFVVLGAYSVSKTALLGLTKAMAHELGSQNIRVNCVAPGVITTKFSCDQIGKMSSVVQDCIQEKLKEVLPLGRFGVPSEIAGVVSFLVSDDASFITGETYIAAGGQASRL